jgi:hypothetical protein
MEFLPTVYLYVWEVKEAVLASMAAASLLTIGLWLAICDELWPA